MEWLPKENNERLIVSNECEEAHCRERFFVSREMAGWSNKSFPSLGYDSVNTASESSLKVSDTVSSLLCGCGFYSTPGGSC